MKLFVKLSTVLIHACLMGLFLSACSSNRPNVATAPAKVKKASGSALQKAAEIPNMNSYYDLLMALQSQRLSDQVMAEKFLNLAVKADESSSYLWSQKAYFEAAQSNWDAAVQDAEKSLKYDPKNTETLLLMGKLMAARNQPEKAMPYYRRVLAMKPDHEEAYIVMARELVALGKFQEAVAALKRCASQNPESLNCTFFLAAIFEKAEKNDEAIVVYEQIEDEQPGNPRILQSLGNLYLKKLDFPRALEIFTRINKLYPNDLATQIKAAIIHYELHQVDEAIEIFQDISKRYPVSDRMYYFLGLLHFEKKDYKTGINYLKRVKHGSDYFQEALLRQAMAYKLDGKLPAAISLLERQVSKAKDQLEIYDLIVTLHLINRNNAKALAVLEKAQKFFPDNMDLVFRHAVVLDRMDRWTEAEQDLLRIIAKDPNHSRALNYLGYTYVDRMEKLEDARVLLMRAVTLRPKDGYILDSLGWYYFKSGQISKALKTILMANQLAPNEPAILEHLGDIYLALKNEKLALVFFNKALSELKKMPDREAFDEELETRLKDKLGKFE